MKRDELLRVLAFKEKVSISGRGKQAGLSTSVSGAETEGLRLCLVLCTGREGVVWKRTTGKRRGSCPSSWAHPGPSHPHYLVLTSGTDPHALGDGFQRRVEAVQVIHTGTRVAHQQLAAFSANTAKILVDITL